MGFFDLRDNDPQKDDRTRIDPEHPVIDAFNNDQQEMADQDAIVMREMQQTYGRAAEYESFQLALPVNQAEPALLAGFDLSRMKLRVTSTMGGVVIGHRSSVATGQGFALPTNSIFEIEAYGDIYIRNMYGNDVAYVSVWIEKSAQ